MRWTVAVDEAQRLVLQTDMTMIWVICGAIFVGGAALLVATPWLKPGWLGPVGGVTFVLCSVVPLLFWGRGATVELDHTTDQVAITQHRFFGDDDVKRLAASAVREVRVDTTLGPDTNAYGIALVLDDGAAQPLLAYRTSDRARADQTAARIRTFLRLGAGSAP
jgi:hypothetical protein